ncbi:hypothetical protein LZ32DRAFT_337956 [Colletotrichum eremochloae]|nr:hypothetical protein LZ32DRAFT_337956 [Colletotrichum eremochloae]
MMESEQSNPPTTSRCSQSRLEPLRKNARIVGCHRAMCVRCDRCDRRIELPVSNQWLLRLHQVQGQYAASARSVEGSCKGELETITIRASPKLCPGYNDGSCLALRTSKYIRTWKEFKSLPGVYKTDREWLGLRYPPAEGYSVNPNWQDKLKNAARSMSGLTPPYIRYLSWRFAWHLFWYYKGMRHECAPLERMWGNVAADVLLWHFGLLQDHDLEALYCTSVGSLLGLLVCRWDYGIAVLEMFYAIRQDLDKDGFNPLKSAVQRANTAMSRYIKANIKKDDEEDDGEQRYQRMLLNSAFRVAEKLLRHYATEEQHQFFAKLYFKPPDIPREAFSLLVQDRFDKIEEEPGEQEHKRADKSIQWLVHHIAEHEAIHGQIEPGDATVPHELHMNNYVNELESWFGPEFIKELAESL